MKEKLVRHKYEIVYGIFVVLIFGFIYYPFIWGEYMYMYMDIGADTYCSYWPSISYAASLIKDLKIWDNSLGLGSSTIIQIAYFLVDPFNWVIFCFKSFNMDIGIIISLALKYIMLSVFAYKYNRIMGFKGTIGIITSLCIVFSGWFVGWGQHYNYATVYVLTIAILYFMECWIQKNKFTGYVISLAILAMCSVYYCYMSLLFLGCYYLVRRLSQYSIREYKILISHGIKTVVLCILGIGAGSVVFLPAAVELLNSPRVSGDLAPRLSVASLSEYLSLLLRSFSNNIMGINNFYGYKNWYESPFVYVGILFFYMIPYFFFNKEISKKKKIVGLGFFGVGLLFMQTVAIVFNAFSTITYRWTFVLIPLMSYIIGRGLEYLEESKRNIADVIVFVCLISINFIYTIFLLNQNNNVDDVIQISIICLMLTSIVYFVMLQIGRFTMLKCMKEALLCCLVIELAVNGAVSVQKRSMIAKNSKSAMGYFDASNDLIEYLDETDSSFYRIEKNYSQIDLNDSMIQKYNSEKYYYSTLSESYLNIENMFNLRIPASNYFYGFDDKRVLQDINCGKYFFSNNMRNYYNYKLIYECNGKYLYQNLNDEGFGILYNNYISRSDFEQLDEISRQDILYTSCVVEDEDTKKMIVSRSPKYESSYAEKVSYEKKEDGGMTIIELSEESSNPLIIEITNLSSEDYAGNLYTGDNAVIYADENSTVLVKKGETKYYNINVLDIDKIYVTANDGIELNVYKKRIGDLQEIIERQKSRLSVTEQTDEYFQGKIITDSESILYIPLIYDKNWRAYVNDKEVPVYRINGGFCGVLLEAGENEIDFIYKNDALLVGMIISGTSLIILVIMNILKKEKKSIL